MLEFIFRGFIEWCYAALLECWEYCCSDLIDVMNLDSFLTSQMPAIDKISQVVLAVGWALLIGNFVFQALKSMVSGLGFDGEDPRLLFARTFVFAFLLLVSPQICDIVMTMTGKVVQLLGMPQVIDVTFPDDSVFAMLGVGWLLIAILNAIIMFKSFKLVLEVVERYVILATLTITAPLAFAMGGSKNTAEIFTGWCRMYGSMSLLMATHVIFFKMLFSVLSTIPDGLTVIPWFILLLAIIKTAQKADAIITRIGLNPAITGAALGSRVPGMLAFTVVRTAVSQATKAIGSSIGGGKNAGASGKPPGGGTPRGSGPVGSGGTGRGRNTGAGYSNTQTGPRQTASQQTNQQSTSSQTEQQNTSQQTNTQNAGTSRQTTTQQNAGRQYSASQNGGQQTNSQSSASAANQQSAQSGGFGGDRKTYVPPGARRSASYVQPSGGSSDPQARQDARQGPAFGDPSGRPGAATASAGTTHISAQPGAPGQTASARYGAQQKAPAGRQTGGKVSGQTAGVRTGAAGTGTRFPRASAQTNVKGGAVSNSVQSTEQNNISIDQTRSNTYAAGGKTAPSGDPVRTVPGGPMGAGAVKTAEQAARSTRREPAPAKPEAAARQAPASAAAGHPGAAGTRGTARRTEKTTLEQKTSGPEPQKNRSSDAAGPTSKQRSSSAARQESGTAHPSAAGQAKNGAPIVRPGAAGTASDSRQAKKTARSSVQAGKQAKPVRSGSPETKAAAAGKSPGARTTHRTNGGG